MGTWIFISLSNSRKKHKTHFRGSHGELRARVRVRGRYFHTLAGGLLAGV